jgi:hypothetical protein
MNLNKETILLYIRESEDKIKIIENDILTYQIRIKRDEKEIETIKYFIDQYKKTLTLIDKPKSECI